MMRKTLYNKWCSGDVSIIDVESLSVEKNNSREDSLRD